MGPVTGEGPQFQINRPVLPPFGKTLPILMIILIFMGNGDGDKDVEDAKQKYPLEGIWRDQISWVNEEGKI